MKVFIKTPIYSKKRGMYYVNIPEFEGTEEECKVFVRQKYSINIQKGQEIPIKGFLSTKYIKIK